MIFRRVLSTIVVLSSFFSIQALYAQDAHDWKTVYSSKIQSIAILIHNGGLCAGSLIAPDRILTAAHCVRELKDVSVQWSDSTEQDQAEVEALAFESDLALLKLKKPSKRAVIPILQDDELAKAGEEVIAIGHPLGIKYFSKSGLDSDLNYVLSRGIISKINPTSIITDLSLSPGNSGGPVINKRGEIIGVVSKKAIATAAGQVGYLAPAHQIRDLTAKSTHRKTLPIWQAKGYPIVGLGAYAHTNSSGEPASSGCEVQLGYSFFSRLGIVRGTSLKDVNVSTCKDTSGTQGKHRYQYFEIFYGGNIIKITPVIPLDAFFSMQLRKTFHPDSPSQQQIILGGKINLLGSVWLNAGIDIQNPKSISAMMGLNLGEVFFPR